MQWLLASVCRLSYDHISKTKQDRPQLLWNTVRKLARLIPLQHSDPPVGIYTDFKYKITANINTASCFTLASTTTIVNRADKKVCLHHCRLFHRSTSTNKKLRHLYIDLASIITSKLNSIESTSLSIQPSYNIISLNVQSAVLQQHHVSL